MTGQIDRDPGLCGSAILPDAPRIVADAATDPRTIANPLVAGEVGLDDGAVDVRDDVAAVAVQAR